MTSDAGISSRSPRPWRSAGPTTATGMPSSTAACAAARISSGARSPPIASTAIGNINEGYGSADVDSDAVLVPTARRAHRVRQLGGGTPRAHTARRGRQLPRAGTMATRLRLRLLLLGNGHGSLP